MAEGIIDVFERYHENETRKGNRQLLCLSVPNGPDDEKLLLGLKLMLMRR